MNLRGADVLKSDRDSGRSQTVMYDLLMTRQILITISAFDELNQQCNVHRFAIFSELKLANRV